MSIVYSYYNVGVFGWLKAYHNKFYVSSHYDQHCMFETNKIPFEVGPKNVTACPRARLLFDKTSGHCLVAHSTVSRPESARDQNDEIAELRSTETESVDNIACTWWVRTPVTAASQSIALRGSDCPDHHNTLKRRAVPVSNNCSQNSSAVCTTLSNSARGFSAMLLLGHTAWCADVPYCYELPWYGKTTLQDVRWRGQYSLILETLDRLVAAVQYLHRQGLLHRDIKPANVVISPRGDRLHLIDFENSCLRVEPRKWAAPTTYQYWCYEGHAYRMTNYDVEVDYWACGVVALTLLHDGCNPIDIHHSPNTHSQQNVELIESVLGPCPPDILDQLDSLHERWNTRRRLRRRRQHAETAHTLLQTLQLHCAALAHRLADLLNYDPKQRGSRYYRTLVAPQNATNELSMVSPQRLRRTERH